MRSFIRLVTVLGITGALATTGGCMSMSKQCYGDGVCKVTKNGVVTYEGPPDKVAEYEAKDNAAAASAAAADQEYKDAPKRAADAPIRVVVIANASTEGLAGLMPQYAQILEQSLAAASPRIEIVPAAKIKMILGGETKDGQKLGGNPAIDENLTRALRDMSGVADIAVVLHADEKKKTGLVSGGGGAGVAEVVNAEFSVSLSSVYAFAAESQSKVGKSTAGITLAGLDKDGKAREGEIKSDRNVEADRPALAELATWMQQTIDAKIGPELPDQAAAEEIRKKHGKDMLKQIFGGK
jgi:hypothetical protein